MTEYTVTVHCPRCSTEMTVEVWLSGGYAPATRWEPEEQPEVESDAPTACTHIPAPDEEFDNGPYTDHEKAELEVAITEEAYSAHADAQFDPAWDGPCEDDR